MGRIDRLANATCVYPSWGKQQRSLTYTLRTIHTVRSPNPLTTICKDISHIYPRYSICWHIGHIVDLDGHGSRQQDYVLSSC